MAFQDPFNIGQAQAQADAATRNAISSTTWPYQLLSFLASLSGQAGGGTGEVAGAFSAVFWAAVVAVG